jgi:hypothetical protein
MVTNYPLTIEEFRTWLESKDENELVGEIGLSHSCPIANALKTKAEYVRVKADTTVADDYFTLSNPDWVEKFVLKIDDLENEERSVTAKEALEVLEDVQKYDIFNKN